MYSVRARSDLFIYGQIRKYRTVKVRRDLQGQLRNYVQSRTLLDDDVADDKISKIQAFYPDPGKELKYGFCFLDF